MQDTMSTTKTKTKTKGLTTHIVILATFGMGHLILLAELAKCLAAQHGATITLFTFASTASATLRAFLAYQLPTIAPRTLPPVDLSDLLPGSLC